MDSTRQVGTLRQARAFFEAVKTEACVARAAPRQQRRSHLPHARPQVWGRASCLKCRRKVVVGAVVCGAVASRSGTVAGAL